MHFSEKNGFGLKNLANFSYKRHEKMDIYKPQGCESITTQPRQKTTLISTEELLVLGLVNDQLFLSSTTKRSPNFSNQTTTFLGKQTKIAPPYRSCN